MSKIRVLGKHLAELIAAGEVVERPGSALKELLENSIDSGASKITVKVRYGGVGTIQVTDNGSGIERADVRTAFKKNATSKIKDAVDLYKISTLGFRGEALASICAVSKVELVTKTKSEPFGTHYQINGGEEILFEEGSCPNGTTVVIKDLFYNVPARMKFLKSNKYEGNVISKVVETAALSHPEICFKFFKDKKEELTTAGDGNALSSIYTIYGKTFSENLIPVNYKSYGLEVEGYITKPEFSSASRNNQVFFVNKRYIKSSTIRSAVEESYKGSSMVGKFPSCVLYIRTPYDFLDVNVHPAKTEVRFNNEKAIYGLVYYAAKNTLSTLNSSVFPFVKEEKIGKNSTKTYSRYEKKNKDLANFEKNLIDKYINEKKLGISAASVTSLYGGQSPLQISLDDRKSFAPSLKKIDLRDDFSKITKNNYLEIKNEFPEKNLESKNNRNEKISSIIESANSESKNNVPFGSSDPKKSNFGKKPDQTVENKYTESNEANKNCSFSENFLKENDGNLDFNSSSIPESICNETLSSPGNNNNLCGKKSFTTDENKAITSYSTENTEKFEDKYFKCTNNEVNDTTDKRNKDSLFKHHFCGINSNKSPEKIQKNLYHSDEILNEQENAKGTAIFGNNDITATGRFDIKKLEKEEISKHLIGEAFKTYIILEINKNEIMFIDKHAAHERIIYEKIKTQEYEKNKQILMEPTIVSLNKDEYEKALLKKDLLDKLGFSIEDFGTGLVIIRSVPLWVSLPEIQKTFLELLGDIMENKKNVESSKLEWTYKNIACRAAVKANDTSKREELIALVQQISEKNIKYCPHGRPIYFILNKFELEKKFFRK